jgi:xylulokinase
MSYLGIDLGTSSVKVVFADTTGNVLREASVAYPTNHPEPGAAEQDPADWWRATGDAVRALDLGIASVKAIGLTGQMHGLVSLNAADDVVRPAIIWSDTRGAATAAELTAMIGEAQLAETAGTALASGFVGVSAAWLREFEPQHWQSIASVLLPKDYIRFRLTGEKATDPSDAASTGLLDVHERAWSAPMLEAVGLDQSRMPVIRGSATVAGHLTAGAATALTLRTGVPVVCGGGDAPVAALASGVGDGRSLLATLSSGAQVIVFSDTASIDPRLRVHTFASPLDPAQDECGWYIMGATMVAGSALYWLRDNVFRASDADAITTMLSGAGEVPAGANGLVFAPYLSGERTPHFDSRARAVFMGLTSDHDQRHMTRAVMEGVVFALRDALDIVSALTDSHEGVVLAGGGARSPLWRQIVADIFDLPVRPSLVADQSAVGAALLAAASDLGVTATALGEEWARFDATVEPIAANVARYGEIRSIFRDIYPTNADYFHRLSVFG